MFRITSEIKTTVFYPHSMPKFHDYRYTPTTFWVNLLTDRQTDRQTDSGENSTSAKSSVINARTKHEGWLDCIYLQGYRAATYVKTSRTSNLKQASNVNKTTTATLRQYISGIYSHGVSRK